MTSPIPFVEFPKIARLSREVIVTEKIDGTNGVIQIGDAGEFLVGSRSRWLTPETGDNHGFLLWAMTNRDELMKLGPGRHFGEWWGSGIQRGYGLPKGEKRWSLFNVSRWCRDGDIPQAWGFISPGVERFQEILPACVGLVPVLYRGLFTTEACEHALENLRINGSVAASGWNLPEGIVIFHTHANIAFKKTIERDQEHKTHSKTMHQVR